MYVPVTRSTTLDTSSKVQLFPVVSTNTLSITAQVLAVCKHPLRVALTRPLDRWSSKHVILIVCGFTHESCVFYLGSLILSCVPAILAAGCEVCLAMCVSRVTLLTVRLRQLDGDLMRPRNTQDDRRQLHRVCECVCL